MPVKRFLPFLGLGRGARVWNQRVGWVKYILNSCDCNMGGGRVGSIEGRSYSFHGNFVIRD